MKLLSVTIQMKATEQYFPVVLFVMLYKVALVFECVGKILKFDHVPVFKHYRYVVCCFNIFQTDI